MANFTLSSYFRSVATELQKYPPLLINSSDLNCIPAAKPLSMANLVNTKQQKVWAIAILLVFVVGVVEAYGQSNGDTRSPQLGGLASKFWWCRNARRMIALLLKVGFASFLEG